MNQAADRLAELGLTAENVVNRLGITDIVISAPSGARLRIPGFECDADQIQDAAALELDQMGDIALATLARARKPVTASFIAGGFIGSTPEGKLIELRPGDLRTYYGVE